MSAPADTLTPMPPMGFARVMRGLLRDPRSAAGVGLVLLAVVAAAFAGWIAPFDPEAPDFINTLAPPTAGNWLGTDDLGRDVLSRIIYGARASLFVGVLSVVAAAAGGAQCAGHWRHFGQPPHPRQPAAGVDEDDFLGHVRKSRFRGAAFAQPDQPLPSHRNENLTLGPLMQNGRQGSHVAFAVTRTLCNGRLRGLER